ncbi:MAG: hypothetical protein N3E37_05125 [Candidatus Micrarchaeota archaeon]|nr:hypothetical protein [Candidatus Micrarchaeota archaeon]
MNNIKSNSALSNKNSLKNLFYRFIPLVSASLFMISCSSYSPHAEYFNYYPYKVRAVAQSYTSLNLKSLKQNNSSENFHERLILIRNAMKSLEEQIINLSQSKIERGGYIVLNSSEKPTIMFVESDIDRLLQYLLEFQRNDFTHKINFLRTFYVNKLLRDIIEIHFWLDVHEVGETIHQLSDIVSIKNDESYLFMTVYQIDELKNSEKVARQNLEKIILALRYNYPWFLNHIDLSDEGMTTLARFYVRAEDDVQSKPIMSDLENSRCIGDLILITKKNNNVIVYYISNGGAIEVFRKEINSNDKH